MKRGIALIALLLLLIACNEEIRQAPQPVQIPQIEIAPPMAVPDKPQYEPPPTSPKETGEVVEIKMEAKNFEFLPSEIKVKKGDRVKLIITSQDVTHTFTLHAFGIEEELPVGQDVEIEFLADQAGTFAFYCNVPGHSKQGMSGKLIVT